MNPSLHALAGLLLCLLVSLSIQNPLFSQTVTPDITVALDGSGDFTKIQDAIDAVPDNSATPTVILIKRGLYNTEKLIVPANKTKVVLIGESRDETIISYHIHDCATGGFQGKCPAEDAQRWSGENIRTSATFTVLGNDFRAENLTFRNTAGPVGQAQALTIRADRVIIRNCNVSSYQDTIYFWSNGNRSYFENCLIIGRTDYIYGGGKVFFQGCEIRSWGGGWITAPSTPLNEDYGFVFNECQITYALNSPRAGDDGAPVALGRPWNDYPKVAWLYCEMTEKIDPLGWPTTWNMSYAATSPDLHLYEYKNTGPGADMSGRADWVGIRALTDEEAANYTVQKVLSGSDGWDPTAEAPTVVTYQWTGGATSSGWLLAGNWNPQSVPDTNQAAYVEGTYTITADGGHFPADLTLAGGATLEITAPSEVTYLAIGDATIKSTTNVSLDGRMRTKDTLTFAIEDTLALHTPIIGVHQLHKSGNGNLQLHAASPDFTGFWTIAEGTLSAIATDALGQARGVTVDSLATLVIESSYALFNQTPLRVQSGGRLVLNADIVLSEFYLGGVLQSPGVYSATTHPDVISGSGSVTVGRPSSFTFIGGANGNWDNPDHFQPALLPLAGEVVYTAREMETTSFVFPADIVVQAGGRIRLRGEHSTTGTISLEAGTSFGYATSGAGFSLNAPTLILGDVSFNLNSRAVPDHAMRLGGPISGNAIISVFNQRNDTQNTGIVVLSGDNSGFTGTWDLTKPSGTAGSLAAIQGTSANAFGQGLIEVGVNNRAVLSHEKAAGDELRVNLYNDGRVQLDTVIRVDRAVVNGLALADGLYTAGTHPVYFVGDGALIVGMGTAVNDPYESVKIYVANRQLYVEGVKAKVSVYDLSGRALLRNVQATTISLDGFLPGLYVVRYIVDGRRGVVKVMLP